MELVPLQISISAVKHKKTYPKRHNWLDKADIELLLAQPPQTKIGVRDRFIILFLFSTGARLAEMRSVQLKDVIINEKYPYIRITGKGNKPHIVPIPEDSFLKNYKYYCHLYHPKENPDDYLFYPTAKGGREMMSEDNVQRILKKVWGRCPLFQSKAAFHPSAPSPTFLWGAAIQAWGLSPGDSKTSWA